jgi:beta-phosphoglucomutase-like phosphatase (HAD superfamily)
MSDTLMIFDCDGVLVDSEPLACRILAEALRGLGLAIGD